MPAEIVAIADNCGLLRRINPQLHVIPDKNTGQRRLSSGAFRDPRMSVDAECLLIALGKTHSFSLRGYENFYLVRIRAGFARGHGQQVEHRPIVGNDFHTEVIGKKPQPICRALRDNAEWVVPPGGIGQAKLAATD